MENYSRGIKVLNVAVVGVTFEGRQAYIKKMNGKEPVRLEPEPLNPYDPNAIAVMVAFPDAIHQIGYLPKDIAAIVAPHLDGESLMCTIAELTGGFELSDGDIANLGVRLHIELPA